MSKIKQNEVKYELKLKKALIIFQRKNMLKIMQNKLKYALKLKKALIFFKVFKFIKSFINI